MRVSRRLRALYGASALNLLVLTASFAIAGAAVAGWFQRPRDVVTVLLWFGAAIVLHDLVALPLYSLLDRIAFGTVRAGGRRAGGSTTERVDPTAYLRIPVILSGVLLLVFFPVIFGLGSGTERSASGIPESGYLARWLLAVGIVFTSSGVAYAIAMARARASARPAAAHPVTPTGPPIAPHPPPVADPPAPPDPPAPTDPPASDPSAR